MRTLGEIGPQAETATPQLVEIAAGRNQAVNRQSQGSIAKLKRSALWRFKFFREEFKRPWLYPRLDYPDSGSRAITLKIQRRDAAITILQVTSNTPDCNVAVATLRELWTDSIAGLNDDYLKRCLGRKKFERVKMILRKPIRCPANYTMKYQPQYYCGICQVKFEDYDPESYDNDFASRYTYLVCRKCQNRASTQDGGGPEHDIDLDQGDNPVFIDGFKCWRRYRFGGFITMRDWFDCQSIKEFYEKVGMGAFNTVTNPLQVEEQ